MNKKLLFVLGTIFCMMIIFTVIPVRSQTPYDPWMDLNDDGKINLIDVFREELAFGASGDPINKTTLLINVNNTFTSLLSEINSCNSSLNDLSNRVAYLETNLNTNTSLTYLSSRIDSLNATLLDVRNQLLGVQNNVTILQGSTDTLNATLLQLQSNVTVLQSNITSLNATVTLLSSTVATLQTNFAVMNATLVQMNSTINTLNATLTNQINNLQAEINMLNLYKLGNIPDWQYGWFYLSAGGSVSLTHNLGTDNVLVYMIGAGGPGGYNQIQYGGDNGVGASWGAYWSQLTTTTITITRQGADVNWPYIKIMIWRLLS